MRNICVLFVLVALALVVVACKQKADGQQAVQTHQERTVSADEFEKIIADTAHVVLVDVRTKEEYDEGHLKGALLYDVRSNKFRVTCQAELPAGKTVAVYCRSGFRSKTAATILSGAGFDVVNLAKGFTGWKEAGKEWEK